MGCGYASSIPDDLSQTLAAVMGDGEGMGGAHSDLARIQDIKIWPLLVAWPAGTVPGLPMASF